MKVTLTDTESDVRVNLKRWLTHRAWLTSNPLHVPQPQTPRDIYKSNNY